MSDPRERLRQRLEEPDARQQLRERLEDDGAGMAFGQTTFNRFVNNLLNLPNVPINAVRRIPAQLGFVPPEQAPSLTERVIPTPTIQGIGAVTRSIPSLLPGGETPGEAFARNREQIAADEAAMREAHPVASGAGDIGGDIATLITGRAPVANLIRRAEQRLAGRTDIFFGKSARELAPGAGRFVDRAFVSSPAVRRLARGAGRSVETGLEGAVLEVLKGEDADPLEAAAFASGGQVVGSVLLEGGKGLLSGGVLKAGAKVSIAAASIAGLWQLGKSATPGGRDFILESIETGYDKVAYSLMLGALAAVSGAGRGRSGKMAEDFPKLLDALATVPRGASLSIITDMAGMDDAELAEAESALNGLARDPDYEGDSDLERQLVARIRKGVSTDIAQGFSGLTKHHNEELSRGGVRNADGSISTVRTMVVNIDGKETIIPTVWDGKIVSDSEAIKRAIRSGVKWPQFDTVAEAEAADMGWHQALNLTSPSGGTDE